jgi:hypothetical protein
LIRAVQTSKTPRTHLQKAHLHKRRWKPRKESLTSCDRVPQRIASKLFLGTNENMIVQMDPLPHMRDLSPSLMEFGSKLSCGGKSFHILPSFGNKPRFKKNQPFHHN